MWNSIGSVHKKGTKEKAVLLTQGKFKISAVNVLMKHSGKVLVEGMNKQVLDKLKVERERGITGSYLHPTCRSLRLNIAPQSRHRPPGKRNACASRYKTK